MQRIYCTDCRKNISNGHWNRHLKSQIHAKNYNKNQQNNHNNNNQNQIVEEEKKEIEEPEYIITETDIEDQKNICQICFCDYNADNADPFILECGHKYCKDCIVHYIEIQIKDHNKDIQCLHHYCKMPIEYHVIKMCTTPELFQNYDDYMLEKIILEKTYMYCPYEECGKILNIDIGGNNRLNCMYCNGKISTCCKTKGWHEGFCQNKDGKELQKWMGKKKTKVKSCPKCGFLIEKNGGCNHVYCINCKTHFEWTKQSVYKDQKMYIPDNPDFYLRQQRQKRQRAGAILRRQRLAAL